MPDGKDTLRRVQDGLFQLTRGLSPFVEARMKSVHGDRWLRFASRAVGGRPSEPLDAYGLLKTILDNWKEVFEQAFDRKIGQKFRTLVSTAFEGRNATSHLAIPLTDAEALRYLNAMHEVSGLAKAPAKEIAELKRLYDEQRQTGVEVPTAPKLDLAPPAETTAKPLKPWIEVALPHPDVLANRFKEAEFAADLFAVDAGHATDDYKSPENFYRITFLTEGLKRILTSSMQRLSGNGGDPVIGLQTAFGGGKTHAMLAVYHLAKASDLALLHGVPALAEKAGIRTWRKPKIAAFVGSAKGPDVSLNLREGPKLHTLWGYIAWRLAGEAGLKLIADAEAARTNPASELMVEVFKLAGPSVILLDELVNVRSPIAGGPFRGVTVVHAIAYRSGKNCPWHSHCRITPGK
jgi:Swt1-like HEPN